MKIIGKTDDGFIIEASQNEIANLIGYYFSSECPIIEVGCIITINKIFYQLYNLARTRTKLDEIANELNTYADRLRLIQPIINNNIQDVGIDD